MKKEDQFQENFGIMSLEEWKKIANTKVLLVGLGGLGGHIANSLARIGVKSLVLVDYDRFDISNLNRQLFSSLAVVGRYKATVLVEELKKINSDIRITSYETPAQELNDSVFDDVDIIIDAVDDIQSKLFLESLGSSHHKPLLHGAVGGWYGQIGIALPGSNLLKELYANSEVGLEQTLKSPTFTPAVVANMMVGELIKYVLGNKNALANKIMMIDLLNNECRIVCQKSLHNSQTL